MPSLVPPKCGAARLWKDVKNLRPLLNILGPLKWGGSKAKLVQVFEPPVGPKGLRRFELYAKYVRTLKHSNTAIGSAALDELARCIRMDILPNLRSLTWADSKNLLSSQMFMHRGVEEFGVASFSEFNVDHLELLFQDIAFRMPNLLHLSISASSLPAGLESHIIDLFQELPLLQKLSLPPALMTPSFFEKLSKLKNLRSLDWVNNGAPLVPTTVFGQATIKEDSFPSLQNCAFFLPFTEISALLSTSFSPPNLTILQVQSGRTENPVDTQRLLSLISERCKRLSSLEIAYLSAGSQAQLEYFSESILQESITLETLRPLSTLPTLTSITLKHHLPAQLTKDDLGFLLQHWPDLTHFSLVPDPTKAIKTSALTLEALLPFARNCPNLTRLELFVDATAYCPLLDARDPACDLRNMPVLRSLQTLNVGVSPIEEHELRAMYLSRILPPGCYVKCDVPWSKGTGVPFDVAKTVVDRSTVWQSTQQSFQFAMTMKMEAVANVVP